MSELRRITERYRLDKLVVAGGGGSVFRGADIQSGATVAVKLINNENGESDELREQFLETGRILQSLQHPGVPRVHDFGFTTAGSAFLVAEYLHGSSLAEYAGSASGRVLSLLLLLVDGLEALALQGISARHLVAENVLVVQGAEREEVKILGLGSTTLAAGFPPDPGQHRANLRSFGLLVCQMLRVEIEPQVGIPLEVAVELEDAEALRLLLAACLSGDSQGSYPSYQEVRKALRLALFGQTGRKIMPRTETIALRPELEGGQGSRGGTVSAPAASLGMAAGPAPASGTVIMRSPWPGATVPSPTPEADPGEALAGDPTRAPDPAHGTARIQLPIPAPEDPGPRLFVPPPPRPEIPASGTMGRPAAATVPLQPLPTEPPVPALPPPRAAAFEGSVPSPAAAAPPLRLPVSEPRPEPISEPRAVPPADAGATRPVPLPSLPSPPPVPPPLPRAEPPAAAPPQQQVPAAVKPRSTRRLLWQAGVPLAVVLLAAAALLLWRRSPEPAPPPPPVATPAPPPPVAAPPPVASPEPVHPQIALAETYLGAGDLQGVRTAIDAIPAEEQAAFRPDELERYQRLVDALNPLKREEIAGNLARALERGDLRLLGSLVRSAAALGEADLPPQARSDLDRARRILAIDARLGRAQRSGNPVEVIREATALLQEVPRSARAAGQREQAASGLEARVDAEIESGQFDAALGHLDELRRAWPDRAGLVQRADRIAEERRADQGLEAVLAAVAQAERAGKPIDGLQLLAGARPNRRFAERFQEARQRLEAQFAELDRRSPEIALRGNPEPVYEKGKVATLPLRVTDDYNVRAVEGWARTEGGQFVKLAVRHLAGSDYAMDVPPDLHQNKTVEFYATATDQSGHSGQLGSADRPLLLRRKGWLKTILGRENP